MSSQRFATTPPDVPELDLPPPRNYVELAEDAELKLELDPRPAPPKRPSVHRLGCPVCTTPCGPYARVCSGCGERFGQDAAMPAELPPVQPFAGTPAAPASRAQSVVDLVAEVPFVVWRPMLVLGAVALVFGNGCRCGGLPATTNVGLVVLVVTGAIGCAVRAIRER
jgi:hypothetical protein